MTDRYPTTNVALAPTGTDYRKAPIMATMSTLVELGVPHNSAPLPNGETIVVFPTVTVCAQASPLLTGAGYLITSAGPRGLRVTLARKPRWRDAHPRAFRSLIVALLLLIGPAFYLSVPVYVVLGVRWYRRRRPSFPYRLSVRVSRVSHP